jgi:hypothetical protein
MVHFRSALETAYEDNYKIDPIADNFREVQPLNGRTVKRNFDGEVDCNQRTKIT